MLIRVNLTQNPCKYALIMLSSYPQFPLYPTPVLSDAKTSPPLGKGRGWGKSTWNKGLNVIVDTNGQCRAPTKICVVYASENGYCSLLRSLRRIFVFFYSLLRLLRSLRRIFVFFDGFISKL
jgi:hypothetical protein